MHTLRYMCVTLSYVCSVNWPLVSNFLIVLLITIRFGTYLSPTISSETAALHVCKQKQIASDNKYY